MPFLKPPKKKPEQWKKWEEKTSRDGYRAGVFGATHNDKYTGWYKDNVKCGKGFQTYSATSTSPQTFYEGDWEFDKRHGYGSLSFNCEATSKTLNIYSGEWRMDKMSGSGMKSFPDGGMYRGEFKSGLRHGQGIMYYANGVIYTGEWYKDKRHGVGRLVNNGNYYEGSFKNDQKCGLGRFYHVTKGQLQEGVWNADFPQVTILFDDADLTFQNHEDDTVRMKKSIYEIPPLTCLKNPRHVYLQRAHEVLRQIEEAESSTNSSETTPNNTNAPTAAGFATPT